MRDKVAPLTTYDGTFVGSTGNARPAGLTRVLRQTSNSIEAESSVRNQRGIVTNQPLNVVVPKANPIAETMQTYPKSHSNASSW